MKNPQDRIIEKQNRRQLLRFYVPVSPGENSYFTRYSQARKFARFINALVKPLD